MGLLQGLENESFSSSSGSLLDPDRICKIFVWVKEVLRYGETIAGSHGFDAFEVVLAGDFHKDRFPCIEMKLLANGFDIDVLVFATHQIAFADATVRIVDRVVHKVLAVEVAHQLPVDAVEQVEVKVGSDALGVIVGGQDTGRLLFEVHADEEDVAGIEAGRELAQEGVAGVVHEVADVGAEEEYCFAAPGIIGDGPQGTEVLSLLCTHIKAGHDFIEVGDHAVEGILGDVDGQVGEVCLLLKEVAEQDLGLESVASTKLNESKALVSPAEVLKDALFVLLKDGILGAGEIILVQGHDVLEELVSALIVEVAGGEVFGDIAQP